MGTSRQRTRSGRAEEKAALLDKAASPLRSGGRAGGKGTEVAGSSKLRRQGRRGRKRRKPDSPVQAPQSEESSTARSCYRPGRFRMDPSNNSTRPPNPYSYCDGSQGGFPGASNAPYLAGFNPFMFAYQGHPSAFFGQPGQSVPPPIPMMQPPAASENLEIPNEMEAPPIQHGGSDVEEVPPVTGRGKKPRGISRIKLPNFNTVEDVFLVRAYFEVSCDPVVSTSQKKDHMWQRILERYNLKRGSYPERTVRSLQSRWDTIKTEVGRFAGFYADAVRENRSGMSDADKTSYAAANFAEVRKHSFGFMHCWDIMKDEPKWQDPKGKESADPIVGEAFGEDNSQQGGGSTHVGTGSTHVGTGRRRPSGREANKTGRKTANSDAASASSSDYAARMQDMALQKINILEQAEKDKHDRFTQMFDLEQERIRIAREQQEMQREATDREIMKIKLNDLNDTERMFYQELQAQVMERVKQRGRNMQGPSN